MTKKQWLISAAAVIAVFVVGMFAISSEANAKEAEQNLDYVYTRSLDDLKDSVGQIELTLKKGIYANTATQQNGLSARLMRETSLAKGSLSALPIEDDTLQAVSKFISQVGDYSMSLSKKISEGDKISEEEYNHLEELGTYAENLNKDLNSVKPEFTDNMSEQFKETAEDFTNFPSLIYDGPFSDHIGRQNPKFLEGKQEISAEEAQTIASEFIGISSDSLQKIDDTEGTLPSYNFTADTKTISVSKIGGQVITISDSKEIDSEQISVEDAKRSARNFLENHGIKNMEQNYYVKHDGVVTCNFAYNDNDVLCYPDLIKISVSLLDGTVTEYNATGYIMNHTERQLEKPTITKETAQGKLSSFLSPQSSRIALIPTSGLNEVLCWEFNCKGKNDETVLVYINAETGYEEQILIMRQDDTGILVQ